MSLAYPAYPTREPTYTLPYARNDDDPRDYCCRLGAIELKARIEAYWKRRGKEVEVEIKEAPFVMAMRSGRYDIRSNMKNALPKK